MCPLEVPNYKDSSEIWGYLEKQGEKILNLAVDWKPLQGQTPSEKTRNSKLDRDSTTIAPNTKTQKKSLRCWWSCLEPVTSKSSNCRGKLHYGIHETRIPSKFSAKKLASHSTGKTSTRARDNHEEGSFHSETETNWLQLKYVNPNCIRPFNLIQYVAIRFFLSFIL